jgi:fucose permease
VLLFVAVNFASGLSQYIILLMFGISVTAFSSAAIAVTQDVIHAGLRAVSYSIAVVVQNLLGASMAPLVVGVLYDKFGIQQALLILPFALVLGALLFYLGSRYYESDFNKVAKIALEAEE